MSDNIEHAIEYAASIVSRLQDLQAAKLPATEEAEQVVADLASLLKQTDKDVDELVGFVENGCV